MVLGYDWRWMEKRNLILWKFPGFDTCFDTTWNKALQKEKEERGKERTLKLSRMLENLIEVCDWNQALHTELSTALQRRFIFTKNSILDLLQCPNKIKTGSRKILQKAFITTNKLLKVISSTVHKMSPFVNFSKLCMISRQCIRITSELHQKYNEATINSFPWIFHVPKVTTHRRCILTHILIFLVCQWAVLTDLTWIQLFKVCRACSFLSGLLLTMRQSSPFSLFRNNLLKVQDILRSKQMKWMKWHEW